MLKLVVEDECFISTTHKDGSCEIVNTIAHIIEMLLEGLVLRLSYKYPEPFSNQVTLVTVFEI